MTMGSSYQRPAAIPKDMGGRGGRLDRRMAGVLELLDSAPLPRSGRVLDVGIGAGQVARYLAKRGMTVVGIGLAVGSYDLVGDPATDVRTRIHVVEGDIMSPPFIDAGFEAIVMSHVLEHCSSPAVALRNVHRLLKNGGLLVVFVPPHTNFVSAGHVSMGWNVGQLIYTLLVSGFDVREGQFIERGANVCAFVRKRSEPNRLPPLRGDRGDINILASHGLFPAAVSTLDGFDDGFWGKVGSMNWPRGKSGGRIRRVLGRLSDVLPLTFRVLLARVSTHLLNQLILTMFANPKKLSG